MNPAVEEELTRLENVGVLKKVDFSEWAAPIVTVSKQDGKVRVCGDYEVTVNLVLEVDQYPLPRPEDLFATLAGGKYFSTLDLVTCRPPFLALPSMRTQLCHCQIAYIPYVHTLSGHGPAGR